MGRAVALDALGVPNGPHQPRFPEARKVVGLKQSPGAVVGSKRDVSWRVC